MSSSADVKTAGDEAWGRGNFEDAIDHYSKAINIESGSSNDKNVLKVLYSNRSAAYLKVSKQTASLLDADKCVEFDAQWPKGLVRRGDALFALARYTEAYNAYNSACRLTPNDISVQEKLQRAQNAISGSSSTSSSGWSGRSGRPAALSFLVSTQNFARILALLCFLLYLLPLRILPLSYTNTYRLSVTCGLVSYAISLYHSHGMPQFNMEYAQRVVPDPTTMYLFMCILLLISRPYISGISAMIITETTHIVAHVIKYLEKHPEYLRQCTKVVELRLLPFLTGGTMGVEDWRRLSTSSKWNQFSSKMMTMAAQSEVMHGLFLVVELLLPSRNLLMTIMWWQYLQMRYMLDRAGLVQSSFVGVDARITSVISHRLCPSMIRMGYGYLKTFLAKQVQPPSPGTDTQRSAGGLSSMMPKCCIM
mmetsp:Transcript_10728/g.10773  ORF Transcript_10728/g.10773 Transcript_10728/m.10773 type:complete len:421 (-) Transcript_10728:148-1410(-)|eukprot:CAMPEP_0182419544 /NCGR_PEP_ID=MMETSP1167-20130531/3976_1 /TAXON_ID=2988 /ORGANISM="Mallomonas Sp, Strain CCMP3275" /LENGTH=420 /DNA_ID=CAMNT_0024594523 /DNA_START=116 /DNA_END=1378 /DNA_ORIENTATION=+